MEKFNCAYDELVNLEKLVPNPKNPNKHPKEQIKRLSKIIEFQGQRKAVVVSNRSGFIIKGHGCLEALKLLGWEKCAVDYQDYDSEAQEYADMVADNEIAKWSEQDNESILEELPKLDIDIDMLGMLEIPQEKFLEEDESKYTRKISLPIYEIMGENPSIEEMLDTSKADKFISEIEESEIDNSVKEFLKKCCTRLYEFNYSKIAEYYAHQDKKVQVLMEKLALVLIDLDSAVENGYVELNEFIEKCFLEENEDVSK